MSNRIIINVLRSPKINPLECNTFTCSNIPNYFFPIIYHYFIYLLLHLFHAYSFTLFTSEILYYCFQIINMFFHLILFYVKILECYVQMVILSSNKFIISFKRVPFSINSKDLPSAYTRRSFRRILTVTTFYKKWLKIIFRRYYKFKYKHFLSILSIFLITILG